MRRQNQRTRERKKTNECGIMILAQRHQDHVQTFYFHWMKMSLCVCIVSMLDTSFFHYNKNVSWLLSRRLELSLQLPSLLLLLLAIGVSLQCCHCADEVVVVAVFFRSSTLLLIQMAFCILISETFLFPLVAHALPTYCSRIHVWFSSIFHFEMNFHCVCVQLDVCQLERMEFFFLKKW